MYPSITDLTIDRRLPFSSAVVCGSFRSVIVIDSVVVGVSVSSIISGDLIHGSLLSKLSRIIRMINIIQTLGWSAQQVGVIEDGFA